jgi:uncharacterized iron-regulated protein
LNAWGIQTPTKKERNMKHKGFFSLLFLVVIFGAVFATPPDQPNMETARANLQKARAELQVAEHNKGGHRANALVLVNSAIAEVNKGIAFARTHNHAQSLKLEMAAGSPDQPHMQAALAHLTDARNDLVNATADKGGHRAKALDLVNKAIAEVNLGIAAAN